MCSHAHVRLSLNLGMTFVVRWLFRWSLDQDWHTDFIRLTFRPLCHKSEPYETYSSERLVKLQNGRSSRNQSEETTEECQYR
ncbi:hypothetical protein Y032_0034g2820 [Ancylostoma ceylanicum]|uniref:Secreted protein n=1 Tax=Ancylostoma ceylanicum TaxID=53326 RepID=A0A016ULU3_9BILA|nr:hypothetical protein Y032_0034g2820 [Ancylostoma ceylanicum]